MYLSRILTKFLENKLGSFPLPELCSETHLRGRPMASLAVVTGKIFSRLGIMLIKTKNK